MHCKKQWLYQKLGEAQLQKKLHALEKEMQLQKQQLEKELRQDDDVQLQEEDPQREEVAVREKLQEGDDDSRSFNLFFNTPVSILI